MNIGEVIWRIITWAGSIILFVYAGLIFNHAPSVAVIPAGVGAAFLVVGILWWCCGGECFEALSPDIGPASDAMTDGCIPLVYCEEYNITACGLEKMHPFDSTKYRNVYNGLVNTKTITEGTEIRPRMASRADLRTVHSRFYLMSLHSIIAVTKILEVPVIFVPTVFVRYRVLRPMRFQTGGTIIASRVALERGWCINLGGGFHHASHEGGGGFCVYADITIAIKHMRSNFPERVRKCMIIDLDAHQGNGHERDFVGAEDTYILDMYNPNIYPGDTRAKRAISMEVLAPRARSVDSDYLASLRDAVPRAMDEFRPDFLVYNAGTDCMDGDPLGNMRLSPEGIVARDEVVFEHALQRSIPIVMVLSGGYQRETADVIAASLRNLNEQFGIFSMGTPRNTVGSRRQGGPVTRSQSRSSRYSYS